MTKTATPTKSKIKPVASTPKAEPVKKAKPINGHFDTKQFAKDILAKREKDNLTFTDVAKAAGVERTTIYRAEAGRPIVINAICDLCNWLGKPVQDYLTTK